MTGHNKETDDPIILSRGKLLGYILLAAIVGGIAGYLLCHFITEEEAAELDIEPRDQAAVYQLHETRHPVV